MAEDASVRDGHRWADRRTRGWRCDCCGDATERHNLDVHHLTTTSFADAMDRSYDGPLLAATKNAGAGSRRPEAHRTNRSIVIVARGGGSASPLDA